MERGIEIRDLSKYSISLRDYFAAAALPEILIAVCDGARGFYGDHYAESALIAYQVADRMLAEREKNKNG